MPMRMSFKIQRVFYGLRNFCGFRRWRSGLVAAVIFIIIAAPPNNAVAQFPGVGSEAPSGVAITSPDDVASDASYADTSVIDAGNPDIGGNASNGASSLCMVTWL